MTVVLDTHAWLWWVDSPGRLSAPARRAIEAADGVRLSSMSCWEVATLVRLGRIQLDRDVTLWIRQALGDGRTEAVPLTPGIAVHAGSLSGQFPGDPVDRIIYATARGAGWPLVTRDRALRSFDPGGTIW